uniref:Uncharacterized protein n=1 Tax=Zea mays TaxID=4577 RepID=B6U696_MAIZE|nr:hypothetical protein [Zea mays]
MPALAKPASRTAKPAAAPKPKPAAAKPKAGEEDEAVHPWASRSPMPGE